MTAERLLRTLDQPRRLIWLAFAAIVMVGWSVLLGADPMASDMWREICGSAEAAPPDASPYGRRRMVNPGGSNCDANRASVSAANIRAKSRNAMS